MEELLKELKEKYTKVFIEMGVPEEDAQDTVGVLIEACVQEAKEEGTMEMEENYGDILLEMEKKDRGIKNFLDRKRKDGVTDKDIKEWWNLTDLERRIIIKIESLKQVALFRRLRERGLSQEEAAYGVRKYLPLYGEQTDEEEYDDHSPLPFELRARVEKYINARLSSDPDNFSQEVESFPTFNAFIRSKIKKGKL